jgi:hypothetical protein
MSVFCNVCMCGFLKWGCFCNMYLYYCVWYCLYCVFCIVSFMYNYSYLFCLYLCKDYCHRVTIQLQLVVVVVVVVVIIIIIKFTGIECQREYSVVTETK